MTYPAQNHRKCESPTCHAFFPRAWLYTADCTRGYASPDTGRVYCSKECCENTEGDEMQSAFDFDEPPRKINGRKVL